MITPDLPVCRACQPVASPTPEVVWNRPGLPAVRYRVATFGTALAAMFRQAALEPALRGWTARGTEDAGVAILELWAYVEDILTFYQERAANESYLRTARLRDSVVRLAELVGYQPAPGASATTRLAFTLDAGAELEIPVGTRVKSVPDPGQKAVTFETVEPVVARATWNAIPLRGPRATLTPGPYAIGSVGGPLLPGPAAEEAAKRFAIGDQVIVYSSDRGALEEKTLTAVERDGPLVELRFGPPIADWRVGGGPQPGGRGPAPATPPPSPATIVRWRRRSRLYGYAAPYSYLHRWITAAGDVRYVQLVENGPPVTTPINVQYDLTVAGGGSTLNLDAVKDGLDAGTEVLVVARTAGVAERRVVVSVGTAAVEIAQMSATVTQIRLDRPVFVGSRPSLRDVEVFELDGPAVQLWATGYPATITGTRLLVPRAVGSALPAGKALVVDDAALRPEVVSVVDVVPDRPLDDGGMPFVAVNVTPGLRRGLDADTAVAFANVALASHGETVARERLGAGDGRLAFARYAIARSPISFVPTPGAAGGVASTLGVRVAGVRWDEVPSFFGTGPGDRVFVTERDEDQRTTVRFGDGITGQRPATGADIVARYREGLGLAGVVRARQLKTLLDRPRGLKGAVNPLASEGGADPETLAAAKSNAPATVRTLGRVVSLRDFADAALESALVAKARADHVWSAAARAYRVRLVVAGEQGAPLADTSIANLQADLDARRDPNRALDIVPHVNVPVRVRLRILAYDPALEPARVAASVEERLRALFAFEGRAFGQPVHASDVLAVVHEAPGIAGAALDELSIASAMRRRGGVAAHIPIDGDAIAALDPASQVLVA